MFFAKDPDLKDSDVRLLNYLYWRPEDTYAEMCKNLSWGQTKLYCSLRRLHEVGYIDIVHYEGHANHYYLLEKAYLSFIIPCHCDAAVV